MGPRGGPNQSSSLFLLTPPLQSGHSSQRELLTPQQAPRPLAPGSLRVGLKFSPWPRGPVPSGPCRPLPHFLSLLLTTSSHPDLCPLGVTAQPHSAAVPQLTATSLFLFSTASFTTWIHFC